MTQKNNNQKETIFAKDIMKLYDISYQTVNHYTDFGLLPVLMKKGNVRLYGKKIVEERMKEILRLLEGGYSLRLIRKKIIGI